MPVITNLVPAVQPEQVHAVLDRRDDEGAVQRRHDGPDHRNRLVPPITAAAITLSSRLPPPVLVATERRRDARMTPPMPAMKPLIMKTAIRMPSTLMPARRAASGFPPTA